MSSDEIELTGLDSQKPMLLTWPTPEQLDAHRQKVEAFIDTLGTQGIRFNASPFIIDKEATAEGLADALTFVFYKLQGANGPAISVIWRIVSAFTLSRPELSAIANAGESIAYRLDTGEAISTNNTYHNPIHTFETLLCLHTLIQLHNRIDKPLSPENRILVLLAALSLNIGHTGAAQNKNYCEHEDAVLLKILPLLPTLSPRQASTLTNLIRSQDPTGIYDFSRSAATWHYARTHIETGQADPLPPPIPPQMEDKVQSFLRPEQADTLILATLLHDARYLPDLGLTPDFAAVRSQRLREELARSFGQNDFMHTYALCMTRPRRETDDNLDLLKDETTDFVYAFDSCAAALFTPQIRNVIEGHGALQEELGEDAPVRGLSESIDLSIFNEVKDAAIDIGRPRPISLEAVAKLRADMEAGGFFDSPPFTLTLKTIEKMMGSSNAAQDLLARINLAEHTHETLRRLHILSGPLVSAVVGHIFDKIGLSLTDPVTRAAISIARDIDQGLGNGTENDAIGGDKNPYHNRDHILDVILIADLLGQRATQRAAPASSPLARGLLVLAALVCHWHHTGKGNTVEGEYRIFHLQDRALEFSRAHTSDMSKEMRQSLDILVRSTDPRAPYIFASAAYAFHVGLGERPDIATGCESLARLLGDPALCTLTARLNDAIYIPFVGLGSNYSARAIVNFGREIGQAIDFNFVRKYLIGSMISRNLYQGEQPHPALLVSRNRIASFTSAEAQAIFNPALHALLVAEARKG